LTRNLITGGMGFLGVYLARKLLDDGEEVVLFQRRKKLPQSVADLEGKVEIFGGDIGNWVHVVEAIEKHHIDSIYHSAALLGKDCEESAANAFRVNVIGTLNVLEAARLTQVQDVVFVSSGATYGLVPPRKISNDTQQKAENVYTTTKICSELLGNQYHRQYGVNFRSVRFAMIVGPTRQISYYYGDWSGVIEMAARGKPYVVHSDPNIPCGYIYVKDAARALIELKRAPESRLRQRIYNAHGFMATINEVAEVVRKYIPNAQITYEWDQSEYMRLQNSGVSYEMENTVAHEDFGYQPKYQLDSMIRDFIKEVKAGTAG
jgi:nucleoside-diphosphate-sugar epimerase